MVLSIKAASFFFFFQVLILNWNENTTHADDPGGFSPLRPCASVSTRGGRGVTFFFFFRCFAAIDQSQIQISNRSTAVFRINQPVISFAQMLLMCDTDASLPPAIHIKGRATAIPPTTQNVFFANELWIHHLSKLWFFFVFFLPPNV